MRVSSSRSGHRGPLHHGRLGGADGPRTRCRLGVARIVAPGRNGPDAASDRIVAADGRGHDRAISRRADAHNPQQRRCRPPGRRHRPPRARPSTARGRSGRLLRARLSTITPQALGRGILSAVVVVVARVARRRDLAVAPSLRHRRPARLHDLPGRRAPRPGDAAGARRRAGPRRRPGRARARRGGRHPAPRRRRRSSSSASCPIRPSSPISAPSSTPTSPRCPRAPGRWSSGILERVGAIARDGLSSFLDSIASLIVAGVVGIFDTIGFVVGLVLLPLWVLSVVRDGRSLRGQIASQFAPGLRADAMALLTIVHRALEHLPAGPDRRRRGAVGVAVYVGLEGVERAEIASYPAAIAVAAFMGTAQVIPQLGGLDRRASRSCCSRSPARTSPRPRSRSSSSTSSRMQLVKLAVGGRLGRDLNVRPALALPAFAVISQIGLVWLLLSAPILVIARNTVRYLRGRLAEPPQPAGVLPWERRPRGHRPRPARRARRPPRSAGLPRPPGPARGRARGAFRRPRCSGRPGRVRDPPSQPSPRR